MPEETIRQRYARSLRNFFNLYLPLARTWQVYDNTQPGQSQMVAFRDESGMETVAQETIWRHMQESAK